MNRPTDEQLLAFLEGSLGEPDRTRVLEAIESDPDLARDVRQAAAGIAGADAIAASGELAGSFTVHRPRVASWWTAAAVAATLLVAVPATWWVATRQEGGTSTTHRVAVASRPEPGYVLLLHGRWTDAATVEPAERARRADEYWAWTRTLADSAVLIVAGDLRWEPGVRLDASGTTERVDATTVESTEFVVGMFALRATSYDDAVAIAKRCPHLRYGGTVSVRRVGRGVLAPPAADVASGWRTMPDVVIATATGRE